MKFELTIDCDNAAFEDAGEELARIVSGVADTIRNRGSLGDTICGVRDSNGNTVGSWALA